MKTRKLSNAPRINDAVTRELRRVAALVGPSTVADIEAEIERGISLDYANFLLESLQELVSARVA